MNSDSAFEKFWVDQLEGCDPDMVERITEHDLDFIRGYFYALQDLPNALVSGREEASEQAGYKSMKELIGEATKVMYDKTRQDMQINLENYITALLEMNA